MNLKAVDTNCANSTDVDDLRKKIESALGNVEEIVKNNAVISVATSVEDSKNDIQANIRDDDEIVVYVSIKINKQEPLAIKSTSLHNGVLHNGIDNNHEELVRNVVRSCNLPEQLISTGPWACGSSWALGPFQLRQ